jgi:hypothetical protein
LIDGTLPAYGGGDLLQLGGTFLIDEDQVQFAHVDTKTGGHPDMETLISEITKTA